MPLRRLIATAAVLLASLATAPARAFDAGPHSDMTRDALTAEGFGKEAANVGVVENWFVDYYWNAGDNPFSGHGAAWRTALSSAGLVDFIKNLIFEVEDWPDEAIKGTNHLHFDSGETGFPDLKTKGGVEQEWQRLMKITRRQLQQTDDPLTVVAILGVSLHGVQDFYAHSNWVETAGEQDSPDGPAWSARYGSHPTYFDVPEAARDEEAKVIYSGEGDGRDHGKWNSHKKGDSLGTGLNKDWPGRPLYEKAYVTAYFATRQWLQAARGWLGDDALWRRAQRLGAPPKLRGDLRASLDISQYAGHWQGNGQPCANGIVFCGPLKGWAGSVVSLRGAIKTYHEGVGYSRSRRRFEKVAPAFYATPDELAAEPPVADPAPTADMQRGTRFVKLEVKRMRGYDWALGDPGPDDADLYANARIRGQDFTSTVLHDHDRYSFPKPYGPFTWIRSVPAAWRHSPPVETLTVRVRTGDKRNAGTDDDVFLRVNDGLRFSLEKRLYDDFERDDDDTYAVPLDEVTRAGLSVDDIAYAQIEKSSDGVAGGWFLRSFEVRLNNRAIASQTVNRWIEDDRRRVRASVTRDRRTRDVVPVWFSLEEDDYLYGFDDDGDINRYDRNTAISLGYLPAVEPFEDTYTGDDRLSGRASLQNGEKGQVSVQISTIVPVVPAPVPTPTPTPTATPTASATPSPTPSPTAVPTPTATPGRPDLIITEFNSLSITVKNQGTAPAGPFNVTATGYPARRATAGLAGGASQTFSSGHGCQEGNLSATVDSSNEVVESNEANNAAVAQQIC